ncbi:MAG TPA: hypothetical protein DIV86_03830, partial [Alphaproteobacteria bacterium]|nr:hypothetical protein [Alphaproteobacteria bacterium]
MVDTNFKGMRHLDSAGNWRDQHAAREIVLDNYPLSSSFYSLFYLLPKKLRNLTLSLHILTDEGIDECLYYFLLSFNFLLQGKYKVYEELFGTEENSLLDITLLTKKDYKDSKRSEE